MVNEIINNRSQLIDKKVFEEYYQNEHRKTLLIYRIGIIFLLLINVILLIFYFLQSTFPVLLQVQSLPLQGLYIFLPELHIKTKAQVLKE